MFATAICLPFPNNIRKSFLKTENYEMISASPNWEGQLPSTAFSPFSPTYSLFKQFRHKAATAAAAAAAQYIFMAYLAALCGASASYEGGFSFVCLFALILNERGSGTGRGRGGR